MPYLKHTWGKERRSYTGDRWRVVLSTCQGHEQAALPCHAFLQLHLHLHVGL